MKKITETKIGDCYKNGEHYYMQRDEDVLHVNSKSALINILDVDFLNQHKLEIIEEVSDYEYLTALNEVMDRLKIKITLNL